MLRISPKLELPAVLVDAPAVPKGFALAKAEKALAPDEAFAKPDEVKLEKVGALGFDSEGAAGASEGAADDEDASDGFWGRVKGRWASVSVNLVAGDPAEMERTRSPVAASAIEVASTALPCKSKE